MSPERYSQNSKRAVAQSECTISSAGVRRETYCKQRGVVIEPKALRECDGRSVGHECLVHDELVQLQSPLHHGAHQALAVPVTSMFRVGDDAGVDRVARTRSKLTESNDFRFMKRRPYIRVLGADATMFPLFIGTRGLQSPNRFRFGFHEAPYVIGRDRTEALRRQPTLERGPDALPRSRTQYPTCRDMREKLFRGGRAAFIFEPSDPVGRRRNHGGVSANEEPDPAIVIELCMRRHDDARILKDRNGYAEKPRPIRVDEA